MYLMGKWVEVSIENLLDNCILKAKVMFVYEARDNDLQYEKDACRILEESDEAQTFFQNYSERDHCRLRRKSKNILLSL